MDTIDNEMINTAAEEAVNDTVNNAVDAAADYADEHPIQSLIAGSVVLGAGAAIGAYAVKGAVKLGKKAVTWIGDKVNDHRAKKAKKVEGTDKTVEAPVQE